MAGYFPGKLAALLLPLLAGVVLLSGAQADATCVITTVLGDDCRAIDDDCFIKCADADYEASNPLDQSTYKATSVPECNCEAINTGMTGGEITEQQPDGSFKMKVSWNGQDCTIGVPMPTECVEAAKDIINAAFSTVPHLALVIAFARSLLVLTMLM